MDKQSDKFCLNCELPRSHHQDNWLNEIVNHFFIPKSLVYLSQKFNQKIDPTLEKFFLFFNENHFAEPQINDLKLRTQLFINEATKYGAKISVLKTKGKQTNNFKILLNDKIIRFNSLPLAEHKSGKLFHQIDDKLKCKQILQKNNFPAAAGRGFWFWQKGKALSYGQQIGFPLVVKPRNGSVSRHVTTDIQNLDELKQAINFAIEYAPTFMIEKYLAEGFVHRITIIDHEKIFCAKQIPANVVGDGNLTIDQLVAIKNADPARDGSFYYPLKLNSDTDLNFIPKNNETVYLQKNPFMKLGGDIEEVTQKVSEENLNLFKKLSENLNIKVLGLDFICQDISLPWNQQTCGILEVNTLPCIEIHHLPTSGEAQNPAKAILQMIKKYYL
ncbi:hypothetical protein HN858_01520 [Candidatus Falkowbacteria bacterium]|jgi:D-alanine-D-alanine ligase-like ATP-grasp enzyme|nr:hypothetical protein [Candidatus Falkowbacteria bacterium]MBT5503790.1 hypothetical protein [Candidatus Falkowbacteria bacterium]MBT6573922.1 hypothetical protein [Candidatus Falkowbacteria bacterium]MBT7348333.1 hypothetical protein [Candidatus Falkowbacteria bacterium]MBT7500284.1 hypothetical protein [Candidatus Falkowbacteria bacterium]